MYSSNPRTNESGGDTDSSATSSILFLTFDVDYWLKCIDWSIPTWDLVTNGSRTAVKTERENKKSTTWYIIANLSPVLVRSNAASDLQIY